MVLKLFLIFLPLCCAAECFRILGIFPTPAASHFTLGFRLMKELVDRGHEVTMVSPYPQITPIENYTDVPVESISNVLAGFKKDFYKRESMWITTSTKFIHNMAYTLTEHLLSHENFQALLKSGKKYDLILMEYFLSDATIGVGKIFDAPVVLFSSLPSSAFTNHLFANPAPSSYVPFILSSYTGKMDFYERFYNLAHNMFDTFYKQFYMLPLHDKLLQTHISKNLDIYDVTRNVSLILLNSHPSVNEAIPHNPNMIEIGGFHISPTNKLSRELKAFMDSSTEGVILFSMGSNLQSSDLDQQKRRNLINCFKKIKEKVLWKFEDDDFEGLPDNVKLVKWLPQQDILAHRNTKAFISHGGMLSTTEAVYFGVPIIGIPIYGDQKGNIAKAVQYGYAVSLNVDDLSEAKLSWALDEILNNTRYTNTAKLHSRLMRDREVQPIDTAIFWLEYVIRHSEAQHMKSSGVDLQWYKRNMLDIIILLVIIDIVLFLIFYYIFKHIVHYTIKKIRSRTTNKYVKIK
ncbi:hypothetical protein NQ317_005134 [Molorchus minor]|uniref:UDP-glucuronosyltransferase n=1 Tax=Molorchus minor TaxID=1323400 RepID=A0ABQ9JQZ1_9CUCU|nr:hypothetical protein NQ317_005134 [Molorchus minor]